MYGIKEFTLEYYHNCNIGQLLIFGGYLKLAREISYTGVIIWVNVFLNHNDTRAVSPMYMRSAWYKN